MFRVFGVSFNESSQFLTYNLWTDLWIFWFVLDGSPFNRTWIYLDKAWQGRIFPCLAPHTRRCICRMATSKGYVVGDHVHLIVKEGSWIFSSCISPQLKRIFLSLRFDFQYAIAFLIRSYYVYSILSKNFREPFREKVFILFPLKNSLEFLERIPQIQPAKIPKRTKNNIMGFTSSSSWAGKPLHPRGDSKPWKEAGSWRLPTQRRKTAQLCAENPCKNSWGVLEFQLRGMCTDVIGDIHDA